MSIKKQVEQAQRQVATWPKWMRDAAQSMTKRHVRYSWRNGWWVEVSPNNGWLWNYRAGKWRYIDW